MRGKRTRDSWRRYAEAISREARHERRHASERRCRLCARSAAVAAGGQRAQTPLGYARNELPIEVTPAGPCDVRSSSIRSNIPAALPPLFHNRTRLCSILQWITLVHDVSFFFHMYRRKNVNNRPFGSRLLFSKVRKFDLQNAVELQWADLRSVIMHFLKKKKKRIIKLFMLWID